ncbi:MAG: thioredoxin-dependent thiol peroxidase [Fimbriimonas sp.]
MLKVGDSFPDFELQDQNGETVKLDDLKGQKAVIFFYPKDDTTGCTAEACEFRDASPSYTGARVIGVSPDPVKSHRKFVDKYGLNFTLLADPTHELLEAVGVWVEKSMYGRSYMGVARTTFVLDENGIVKKVFEKVKPQGHAAQIAQALA